MPDTELLIPLAEIAGVFVGFGALIAVRSGGPTEPTEVAPMRMVVSMGMLTIVAALVPGTLSRVGLGEHQVWALGGAAILVGWLAVLVASLRTPEYRQGWAAEIESTKVGSRPRWLAVVEYAIFVTYLLAALLPPVIILLGVVPDLEAALYYAVVVLILLGAGWTLLSLVFAQRLPASA
jgi:Na+/melibiose symporter-like transporter